MSETRRETNRQEWHTADKAAWGRGPWQEEPDKVQWVDEATGLDCLIVRGPLGALCGYVGIPETHPLFGKDYEAADVEVHGGLTFADSCTEATRERFDAFRARFPQWENDAKAFPRGDSAERLKVWGQYRDDYEGWAARMQATAICHVPLPGRPAHVWWFGFDCAHLGDVTPKYADSHYRDEYAWYKDIGYVTAECQRLAQQLAKPEPADAIR